MPAKSQVPDLAEFYALSKPKNPPCQVGLILADQIEPTLSRAEKAQLVAALETDKGFITATAIQGWLKARGHDVSFQRIGNHRRGTCSCD